MQVTVRAPGRVNLIGEHTDYNQGFVLPMAVELFLTVEAAARPGRLVEVEAADLGKRHTFSLDDLAPPPAKAEWYDYIKGVCHVIQETGRRLHGAALTITSSIPVGAGLSSSAALELAAALAMTRLARLDIPLAELALLCQKAESDYVGVRCGAMDQLAVALGRKGHALFIDCRSIRHEHIPLAWGHSGILIVDSRVQRSLGASPYNRRREECEEAVRLLDGLTGRRIQALRDIAPEEVKRFRASLPENLFSRALFVTEENARVHAAVQALRAGDRQMFGELMHESHRGLRDLFQVSCPELDTIVDAAASCKGVWGARMTGAGFGGCAIVFLKNTAVEDVRNRIKEAFRDKGWREPYFYLTGAAPGVEEGHEDGSSVPPNSKV